MLFAGGNVPSSRSRFWAAAEWLARSEREWLQIMLQSERDPAIGRHLSNLRAEIRARSLKTTY